MTVIEYYKKVSKDCFKFIKSQETKKEKFRNKEKMIRSFLIPVCFKIANKRKNKKPYFVGLAGGQGTGKTTTSSIIKIILEKYFKLNIFKISIDDFSYDVVLLSHRSVCSGGDFLVREQNSKGILRPLHSYKFQVCCHHHFDRGLERLCLSLGRIITKLGFA